MILSLTLKGFGMKKVVILKSAIFCISICSLQAFDIKGVNTTHIGVEKADKERDEYALEFCKKTQEPCETHKKAHKILEKDSIKAIEMLTKSCETGLYFSCEDLGMLLYNEGAFGVKKDYAKAVEFTDKACKLGSSLGCYMNQFPTYNLAVTYHQGLDGEKDYNKAAKLYTKACDNGYDMACANLGLMYYDGQGVKQDFKKASELSKKTCDKNNAVACVNLGVQYTQGRGVKQDYKKAKELFGKGCDLGYQMGCNAYKHLNENGF